MEIRNKKETLNPLMKNKKWRLSKKKPKFLFIKSCYMARPYGSAIWQCHMALPYGSTVWLAIWLCHRARFDKKTFHIS